MIQKVLTLAKETVDAHDLLDAEYRGAAEFSGDDAPDATIEALRALVYPARYDTPSRRAGEAMPIVFPRAAVIRLADAAGDALDELRRHRHEDDWSAAARELSVALDGIEGWPADDPDRGPAEAPCITCAVEPALPGTLHCAGHAAGAFAAPKASQPDPDARWLPLFDAATELVRAFKYTVPVVTHVLHVQQLGHALDALLIPPGRERAQQDTRPEAKQGGDDMRAPGENPDLVGRVSGMAGSSSSDQPHEGGEGSDGHATVSTPSGASGVDSECISNEKLSNPACPTGSAKPGFEAAVEWLEEWLKDAPSVRMARSDIDELAEFIVDRLDEERHDTIAECVDFLRDRGNQFDSDAADTIAAKFAADGSSASGNEQKGNAT